MTTNALIVKIQAVNNAFSLDSVMQGSSFEFEIPETGTLIKEQRATLIWRYRLEEKYNLVIKMYRKQGSTTVFRKKLLSYRAQREFEVLKRLHDGNCPCTEPILWATGTSSIHGNYEILATIEFENSVPLRQLLIDPKVSNNINYINLFQAIYQMHELGIYHGSLNDRNILVENSQNPSSYQLIDFSASICFPGRIHNTRMSWFDLLHFSKAISRSVDVTIPLQILDLYKFTKYLKERFKTHLDKYQSSRHTRNRIRGEFKLRSILRI
jgi:tRNA A-37 threonylcarbamoyl transferase component Bud32